MHFKLNTLVFWNTTTIKIRYAWVEACQQAVSMDYVPTLTSGMDGIHSPESGHYYGRALDFRSNDVPFALQQTLKQTAQEILGSDYLVLLEGDHYHIQRNKNTF